MKAKAMVLEAFGQPLKPKEINIPDLAPGQVLVRIEAAGVCGSDVHIWHGEDPRTPLPMVLGHEGVGVVAGIAGEKYTVDGAMLHEGERIFWNRGISCGGCYYCAVLKEPALCTNRIVQGINISCAVPPYLNGCYADYIILPARTDVFKIPADIDPALVVPASCSGATAAHGFSMIRPYLGETVVVLGPGPLGLFNVAFARAYGASKIILFGGAEKRLDAGLLFGADTVVDRNEMTEQERSDMIMDMTNHRGADLVIEAAGTNEALEEALNLARPGGTVLSLGLAVPCGLVSIDGYKNLVRKNLRIQGVWVSDTEDAYRAMNLVLKKQDVFCHMITHRFGLEEANDALRVMEEKEAIKAVLIP